MVGMYSLLLCLCLYGYGFLSGGKKDSGVKLRMLLRLLSGMSFSHFGKLWPRSGSPEAYIQTAPGKDRTWLGKKCKSHLGKNRTWNKNFAARLGGQSELGAVWCDMRLSCKHTCCRFVLILQRFFIFKMLET